MTAQQLKNSILQMAAQGKLVPQDPNDEHASVLLERIRAEKEKLIKEGKNKKEKNPSVIFRGEDNSHYEKYQQTGKPMSDAIVNLAKMEVLSYNKRDLERMLQNERSERTKNLSRSNNRSL